jgi:hypothetical protein
MMMMRTTKKAGERGSKSSRDELAAFWEEAEERMMEQAIISYRMHANPDDPEPGGLGEAEGEGREANGGEGPNGEEPEEEDEPPIAAASPSSKKKATTTKKKKAKVVTMKAKGKADKPKKGEPIYDRKQKPKPKPKAKQAAKKKR